MKTRRLFTALIVVALFAMGLRQTRDPDMWWHLRSGEYILAHGIPRHDVFSFTVPHYEWITHEWLSQVVMWGIYQTGGLPALILVFAGLIALTYWLVYLACPGRPFLAGFVAVLSAISSAIVWDARPQIFNLLLTALFLLIVERVRSGRWSQRALWALPPLTMLWANLHSGYLLGVVLLGTYTVGLAGQRRLQPADGRNAAAPVVRRLALVTGLSFLASGLNVNGPELWIYPFETLSSPSMQAFIQEWHPPDFNLTIFWPFALMLGLGLLGWLFNRERPTAADLLLFGGTAVAALTSARNVPLFAIIAAPVIGRGLLGAWRDAQFYPVLSGKAPEPPLPSRLAALNVLVLGVALLGVAVYGAQKIAGNEANVAERFPVTAVDYLETAGLDDAPGYHSYQWGGYLIWRRIPVFIDGRADVYGDDFIFYYRQAMDVRPDWREPLTDFAVEYVMMPPGSSLLVVLEASGAWQPVYSDGVAQIWTPTPAWEGE